MVTVISDSYWVERMRIIIEGQVGRGVHLPSDTKVACLVDNDQIP